MDWLSLYAAKLLETCVNSSWMVLLMAVPMLTAYGTVYDSGLAFIGLAVLTFLPFLVIPAAIGTGIALVLVNAFPARRTRDILSVIAVLAAAGVVVLSGSSDRSSRDRKVFVRWSTSSRFFGRPRRRCCLASG